MILGVYGGSFDPLHLGHAALIRGVLEEALVDRVLVVPALESPFKKGRLPVSLRWAILQESLGACPGIFLYDGELKRTPPSYTLETILELGAIFPGSTLRLLMGSDVLGSFSHWRHAAEILNLVGLLVISRNGSPETTPAMLRQSLPLCWQENLRPLDESGGGEIGFCTAEGRLLVELCTLALPGISSTEVLASRNPEGIPAPARPLLRRHWEAQARI